MEPLDYFKIAIPIVAVPLAGQWLFKHHFADHNHALRLLNFQTLDECMVELEKIEQAHALNLESNWTLYQNLIHCAQSIEYSMIGFPQNKPKLIQKTIGSMIFHQFEKQGYMRHDRNEPIPGATPIEPNGSNAEAVDRLKHAMTNFENYHQELKPHFVYGNLTKSQFAQAHSMHCADHFAMITY